ncbi:MAG: hypothetical protein ABIJ09_23125 [Pseudomonadota bacterium]
MIDVYIIEELEKERRKDRRDEAFVWISDPGEEAPWERPEPVRPEPPRVIVIDL